MKRMLCLLAILFTALLSTGCDNSRDNSRTRLNPGADLALYEASPTWIWENTPRQYGSRTYGFYDPADGSITIDKTLTCWGKAKVLNHEMTGHGFDHQWPRDGWELMARYSAPGFDFLQHPEAEAAEIQAYLDTVPDPVDVQRAQAAAAAAAALETSP